MNNSKPLDLYLVSSTLHFFWAWLLAAKNKDQRDAQLWFIDQYTNKPMVFLPYMDEDTPFIGWKLFDGRELGGIAKFKQRLQRFSQIKSWISTHQVDRVFIGNDRSVFGQFIIKTIKEKAKQQGGAVTACFLDDGVFTYLGRTASKSWTEKYLDAFFKKLMYGFWYDSPTTVGAGKWIDEAWVMYPEYVSYPLRQKKVTLLGLSSSSLENMAVLAGRIFDGLARNNSSLSTIDLFLALPNQTLFEKTPTYSIQIKKYIEQMTTQGKRIAIKYHPSAGKSDKLSLSTSVSIVFPSVLSFELILVMLKKAIFVGDMSTTTLLAHYFGRVSQVFPGVKNSQSNAMLELCQNLGIKQLNIEVADSGKQLEDEI